MNRNSTWRFLVLNSITYNVVFFVAVYLTNEILFRGKIIEVHLFAYGFVAASLFFRWIVRTASSSIVFFTTRSTELSNIVANFHKFEIKIYADYDIDVVDFNDIALYILEKENNISRPALLFISGYIATLNYLRINGNFLGVARFSSLWSDAYRQYKRDVYSKSQNDRIVKRGSDWLSDD
jgi:hypothetical protein